MRNGGVVLAVFALLGAVLGVVEVLATALTTGRFDGAVSVAVVLAWVPGFAAAGLLAAGVRALAPARLREALPPAAWAVALALGLLVWLHAMALVVLPRINPRRLGEPSAMLRQALEVTALAGGAGVVLAAALLALAWTWRRRGVGVQTLAFAAGALGLLLAGVALRRSLGVDGRSAQLALAAGTAGAALVGAALALRLGLRRGALLLLGLVAAGGALRIALPAGPLSAVRRDPFPAPDLGTPNVVLVVLDTVRADHLELYGYDRATMPNLARFAAGARVYTDAEADSSWTLPSHASLFTGLSPREHGAHGGPAASDQPGGRGARPLRPEAATLAEALRAHGYATVGVGANWSFLRPFYGLDQGFDVWDARAAYRGAVLEGHVPLLIRAMPALEASPLRALAEPLARFDVAQVMYRRADAITDEALRWLAHPRLREGPFLLFVNYLDAHEPYRPRGAFEDRFPGRVAGAPRGRLGFPEALGEEALRAHLIAQYDGELAFLDVHLGRLLDALETQGRLRDTIVVVTADHGEAFGEHGRWGHGTSLYQNELFVPLVVYDPSGDGAARLHAPAPIRALAPWLLGRLGIRAPEMPAPVAHLEDLGPVEAELLGRKAEGEGYDDLRAIREGPLKLILEAHGPELYDLDADPQERHDLAAARPLALARLARELAARGSAAAQAGGGAPLSPEELERLRALGYAE